MDEKLRLAEAADRADLKLQLLILQALALHAEGQMDPAIARLERALTLAVPLGYTLSFVRHGAPMVALLGGGSGNQSLAVVIRAMAVGSLPPGRAARAVRR